MKTSIVSDMNKRYLVVEEDGSGITGYQQKMVLHNKLSGLLQIEQRQVDSKSQYYYDITEKVTLCEYFKKNLVSVAEMEFVIRSIVNIVQSTSQYLLHQDNFVLSPEFIYIEETEKKLFLLFLEGYQVEVREQLVKIAEYFMEKIDYKDEDAVRLAYGLFKELRENRCSFRNVEDVLVHCKERDDVKENRYEVEEKPLQLENFNYATERKEGQGKKKVLCNILIIACNALLLITFIKIRFFWYQYTNSFNMRHILIGILIFISCNVLMAYLKENYVQIGEDDLPDSYVSGTDTIILPTSEAIFELKGNQQTIRISSFPFILGSEQRMVNGWINAPQISKQHAVLEKHNGLIQIKDLNSTNGTFINGELLVDRKLFTLQGGDKITLADRTYKFIKLS